MNVKMNGINLVEQREESLHMREYVLPHASVRHGHRHPIPPHERRNMIYVEFDERDRIVFKEMFGDDDTAEAAISIIHNAPPEIQILAIQVLKMIEEVA